MNSVNPGVTRALTLGMAILIGILFSLFAGRAVAQENYRIILLSGAGFGAMFFFLLIGKNIYLLLAASFTVTGSIGALALPFSYQELIAFAAFGITAMQVAFKKMSLVQKTSPVDWIVWLNLLYLVTVYARNPVGVRALGSEMVGGRPYLVILAAFLFFITLPQYRIPEKLARNFPLIISGPGLVLGSLAVAAFYIPGISGFIYPFWTGVGLGKATIEAAGGVVGQESQLQRVPTMGLGVTILLLLCTYFSVASFISPINFWPFIAFMIAGIFWLASGFRSGFLNYGGYMFFNCYLRGRMRDLIPAFLVGILVLCALVLIQGGGAKLPLGMQRSLSFLPGDWDAEASGDADASTEWRLDMWKAVMEDNEFIKNKVLGDGFGFSAYDLKLQIDALLGIGGYLDGTKSQLITGAYHSGPLSAIRYVGAVGLVLYTVLQITCLVFSVKLVRKAWKTPYRYVAMFLAVPMFYSVFGFYIVFGGFDSDFPRLLMTAGLLKFTWLSLDDYLRKQPAKPLVSDMPAEPAPALAR